MTIGTIVEGFRITGIYIYIYRTEMAIQLPGETKVTDNYYTPYLTLHLTSIFLYKAMHFLAVRPVKSIFAQTLLIQLIAGYL